MFVISKNSLYRSSLFNLSQEASKLKKLIRDEEDRAEVN